ncbi:hypothetical protein THASP1DRAFT_29586 [Thamnocephalis sphaerospora]|uniref:F-box domain-containing protein n=1 Tax=Thamnocephalis sphaerospora TaxID=78915 RepID=A0A4V1IWS9_9FUNG|nr:hypothetical protein THASP1DRAFT_29586 [Thamnocephalis sphaerospora]|eukprot:RKP08619.1 hypothetical protein THASP1DRAFT_29586 [Thamnocephalis sphaerospora]
MNRVPAEIVYRIVYLSDDEAALVALATTSRWLYACVAAQRKLWRLRFERDFPKQDENELRWLRHYARTHLAHLLFAEEQQETLLPTDELLDWFHAYCSRRATEYRWRHGLYKEYQPEQATGTHIGGIRLQSLFSSGRSIQRSFVTSKRILSPQQSPVWITEQLCWGDVDTDSIYIGTHQLSDEYLVIATMPNSTGISVGLSSADLYVWHLDALHLPPRLIVSQLVGHYQLCKNWLIIRKRYFYGNIRSNTLVFDLTKHTFCPDVIEKGSDSLHVQQATTKSIYLLWTDEAKLVKDSTAILFRLWKFTPDIAPPLQCLMNYEVVVHAKGVLPVTYRVDDNRLVLFYSRNVASIAEASNPNLMLMEVLESESGVSMKEKWSLALDMDDVYAIVSRDLLAVRLSYTSYKLLNLDDGSLFRNIPASGLYPWCLNNLYPLRNQWASMTQDAMWSNPKNNQAYNFGSNSRQLTSTNAMLILDTKAATVFDFSV